MKKKTNQSNSLYVFTNDLRINDNRLFMQALEQTKRDNTALICLYCLEAWMFQFPLLGPTAMGGQRYEFLRSSIGALKLRLEALGLALVVRLGNIAAEVAVIHEMHSLEYIYHNQSAGYIERQQWQKLQQTYTQTQFHSRHLNVLFEPDDLPFAVSDLPKHFTPFRKQVEALQVKTPVAPTTEISMTCFTKGDQWTQLNTVVNSTTALFIGGELAAKKHLFNYFAGQAPSTYKLVRNELQGWNNSTKFSPWLALGCVSPRQIMRYLSQYEQRHGANESTYWIYFELLWREFFYYHAIKQQAHLFSGSQTHTLVASVNEVFQQWSAGATGVALVDACMRELNQTGYLSNRGRQIAASYLINELNTDWRLGASYFEKVLVDYDVASNWGNWQYIAGVGADPRGGRHFNIQKQQQTHDPENRYIDQWATHETTDYDIFWHQLVNNT